MARISRDVTVTSQPVRTFPNGDFFYVELSRKSSNYDCILRMAREGSNRDSVVVATAKGRTMREAEENCYQKALERCPRLPRPPYVRRATRAARVARDFSPGTAKKTTRE
jgi:hypothetical protein